MEFPTKAFRNGKWVDIANESELIDGEKRQRIIGSSTIEDYYESPKIEKIKAARIALVKVEAGDRIAALDWQLQRADRHTELNKTPKKARAVVLTAQQKMEDDSDLAEIAINALTTIEEVNAFTW